MIDDVPVGIYRDNSIILIPDPSVEISIGGEILYYS